MTASLPEFLAAGGQLTDRQAEQLQRQADDLNEIAGQLDIVHRRQLHYWAAIVCTCRPWPALSGRRNGNPPQAGCPVHHQLAVCWDGEVR